MAEEKKETPKIEGLTAKQVEDAVRRVMEGNRVNIENMEQVLAIQAEAMKRVAENMIPADSQKAIERQQAEFEDPYIKVDDRIMVIFVSTADLVRIDGWPGEVHEPIPGQYTKQGLQRRAVFKVEPYYNPGLDQTYAFQIMTLDEFAELPNTGRGGNISMATMIGALQHRIGDGR